MQKIVMDVTYIKHENKWHYLACYLDLYNNEIVDWKLSDIIDKFLVMEPAKGSLKKQRALKPKTFSAVTRVYSTLQWVIVTC